MELLIECHDREKSSEAEEILRGLREFNSRIVSKSEYRELTISFKDKNGTVVAGLNGNSNWGWLFIKLLWVSDGYQGQGLGRKLMSEAEREGRQRGCHGVWLDTFSVQARTFYEKLGYNIFGTLDEFPRGHSRFFMKKRLEE